MSYTHFETEHGTRNTEHCYMDNPTAPLTRAHLHRLPAPISTDPQVDSGRPRRHLPSAGPRRIRRSRPHRAEPARALLQRVPRRLARVVRRSRHCRHSRFRRRVRRQLAHLWRPPPTLQNAGREASGIHRSRLGVPLPHVRVLPDLEPHAVQGLRLRRLRRRRADAAQGRPLDRL